MRSFSLALLVCAGASASAHAQGFAVERFMPSAPGGGWWVMDAIDRSDGLRGAVGLTLGYAHDPHPVISNQMLMKVQAGLAWDRLRLYLDFDSPLWISGHIDPGSNPDVISDVRIGLDARLYSRARFRIAAGAQLYVPFGNRADWDTDGTFRGAIRIFAAGDFRFITWAAQLGVHIRPLDDTSIPDGPRGNELLYGAAAGAQLPVLQHWRVVVGPEIFGATAFTDGSTALEALLSGRIEGTRAGRAQLRVKLGIGGGLVQRFGAPELRFVVGVEMFSISQNASSGR
jgi:hypothetical protein